MADLRELRPAPVRAESRLWYGRFAKNVASMSDLALVILPEFDQHRHWGPARWQSRDATSLPQEGDECVVVFDNRMNIWIIAWWPYA